MLVGLIKYLICCCLYLSLRQKHTSRIFVTVLVLRIVPPIFFLFKEDLRGYRTKKYFITRLDLTKKAPNNKKTIFLDKHCYQCQKKNSIRDSDTFVLKYYSISLVHLSRHVLNCSPYIISDFDQICEYIIYLTIYSSRIMFVSFNMKTIPLLLLKQYA